MRLKPAALIRTLRAATLRRGVLPRLAILGALFSLAAAACAQGSYPVDIFYEMHYQPSHHSQEPPRLLPPEGSVPITGKEPTLRVASSDLDSITNPIPGEGVAQGAALFDVNCAMCHGASGIGDGLVLATMIDKYGYTPKLNTNLTLVNVFGYSDGQLFATITNRDLRTEIESLSPDAAVVMPQFQDLLTAEERWMLVNYLKTLGP